MSARPCSEKFRCLGAELFALLPFALLGCSGTDDAVPSGARTETSVLDRFVCPGGKVEPGMNTLQVGDRERSFYAEFPRDLERPLGVVFSWHGYNDSGSEGDSAGWRRADEADASVDPAHPTAVITPIDVDFDPPVGLDWQLDAGTAAENVDLAFFEAMLGCLHAEHDLDAARIYSYGFSAGSVMTSLLHSVYPEVISAVVCESGMWFNDPAQVAQIQFIEVNPSWPALDPRDGGTVLLTHGGPTDVTVLDVANLENMAQAAFPFLKTNDRVVVDCPHTGGHVLHPALDASHVMRFFADHRAGQRSPYVSGEFSGYPAGCTLRTP